MVSLDPIVEQIFDEAIKLGASDIHLEPEENGLAIRYRVAGQMRPVKELDEALKDSLVAKLKLMAGLDSTQILMPQDGSFVLKITQVRLSVIPAQGGQSVVMRLFKKMNELEKLEGLGLQADQIKIIKEAISQLHGLFIIAGPTGSGKTTTFCATLRAIDPDAQKIITVEDPIEQRLEGVCQTPVRGELSFATALRSILRQAPNVIGVGELRDIESARMALQAALTGHLVVATLHAGSCAQVPARLMDMGLEGSILAEVLNCVVAQRLLNSRECGESRSIGVFEVMRPHENIRNAIREHKSAPEIQKLLKKENFVTMKERAEALAKAGKLSHETVIAELGVD